MSLMFSLILQCETYRIKSYQILKVDKTTEKRPNLRVYFRWKLCGTFKWMSIKKTVKLCRRARKLISFFCGTFFHEALKPKRDLQVNSNVEIIQEVFEEFSWIISLSTADLHEDLRQKSKKWILRIKHTICDNVQRQ